LYTLFNQEANRAILHSPLYIHVYQLKTFNPASSGKKFPPNLKQWCKGMNLFNEHFVRNKEAWIKWVYKAKTLSVPHIKHWQFKGFNGYLIE